jgi:hypothetical protein
LYWSNFQKGNVEKTKTGKYKLRISKKNILTTKTSENLSELIAPEFHEMKLHKLILESHWMKIINNGTPVYANCFEWVNKSLSRTEIKLWYKKGKSEQSIDIPTIYCPGLSSIDILKQTFPWADITLDKSIIQHHLREQYENACYAGYDKEDDEKYYYEEYSEWLSNQKIPFIAPYRNHSDEALEYKFRISLNDLGKATLTVIEHIYQKNHLDTHGFSI